MMQEAYIICIIWPISHKHVQLTNKN